MADTDKPTITTLKEAIVTMNPKIVLGFFLVCVAAGLVVFLTLTLTGNNGRLDAGTIALLASFVTMFIKMAADGTGYQFSSSAGSDKKDDTQAKVASSLAEKVSAPQPAPPPPPPPVAAWWSDLDDAEKNAITAAGATDPRTQAIIAAMTAGSATADDLAYLVSKDLLTQVRADAIKS